jgi:hypothetical protein
MVGAGTLPWFVLDHYESTHYECDNVVSVGEARQPVFPQPFTTRRELFQEDLPIVLHAQGSSMTSVGLRVRPSLECHHSQEYERALTAGRLPV